MIAYTYLNSPIGTLRLVTTDRGLSSVQHTNQQSLTPADWVSNDQHPILLQASQELSDYFQGSRQDFSTPLSPDGTDFQKSVWDALTTIPYGQTATYSEIARKIGKPRAARAVGAANGNNPLSIFVPCHRVIGKSGKLVGYAGGLTTKKTLLNLEFSLIG